MVFLPNYGFKKSLRQRAKQTRKDAQPSSQHDASQAETTPSTGEHDQPAPAAEQTPGDD